MSTLEAALDYVGRGWSVLPLYGVADDGACRCRDGQLCPVKNRGKHPRGTKHGWRPQSRAGEVEQWYATNPHDNLGIVTGPVSGIFVLDVDGPTGIRSVSDLAADRGALPPTRIVKTGSGGLHYFFRHPGHFTVHNSTSWVAPCIDIRGQGGQVVAPPSVSGTGAYELLSDHDIAEAPAWLLELLHEHTTGVEQGRSAEVAPAEAVDAELVPEKVRTLRQQTMADGEGRHRHFHSLVAACFEAGYTQGQTVTIVAPWCAAVGKFVGRVEQEVARSWGKLEGERAREAEWLGEGSAVAQVLARADGPLPSATWDGPGDLGTMSVEAMAARTPAGPQIATGDASDPLAADEPDALAQALASWDPVDLESILDGSYVAPVAELFPTTQGMCLVYRGLVHSFHGESESGKSMLAQAEAARLLADGQSVGYIDFESDAPSVVGRLMEMGVDRDRIRDDFHYRRPSSNPLASPAERDAFVRMLGVPYDLVVIDGMTDALSVFGAGSNDMDEVTVFMRTFPRMVAQRTGAAVILVDHVSKDSENRGRHAVGSQAKLNALDGAAYVIDIESTLGRGRAGVVTMACGKDRPGAVRGELPASKRRDRLQPAARVVVDSTGGGIRVTVEPPDDRAPLIDPDTGDRVEEGQDPMTLERVSSWLESQGGRPTTKRKIIKGAHIGQTRLDNALDYLEAHGYVESLGNNSNWVSKRSYSAAEDLETRANAGVHLSASEVHLECTPGTASQPPPPLRGGMQADPAADAQGASGAPDAVDGGLTECRTCFKKTGMPKDGMCPMCRAKAGLA